MKDQIKMFSVRAVLLVLGAGLAGAWLAPLVARAASAAGATLSYAGTLSQNGAPITTPQTLGFGFKKDGVVACNVAGLVVTPDAAGQFTVAIPMGSCPDSLFDGSEVKLDITVQGSIAVADQPITSVPSAKYAEQLGFPDCPVGYDRDKSAAGIVLCRKGVDEIVRVGTRSTSFWIDRYEASVWEFPDGSGTLYGGGTPDYPFPVNGQLGATDKGYAFSRTGNLPSTSITWFQADVACRASGKRLPTTDEWGYAARGTPDPGDSAGEDGKCRTSSGTRVSGAGVACVSVWGAQDMIGNVPEMTSDWSVTPSLSTTDSRNGTPQPSTFGAGFNGDQTTNLTSVAADLVAFTEHLPAVVIRGGGSWEGAGAGIFNLNLSVSTTGSHPWVGFRCVTPR